MNIVVCIKQVPDTTDVKIDPKTNTLIREGVASIINPFDMYAIEESIRIKEKTGGKVTALTMGPPQAETALREAVAMGVDNAILLSDRAFAGSDTWATSYTLAMALKKIGAFNLVVCGKQASDGDTAQVGPGIAAHLDLPQITYVRKIAELGNDYIAAERLLEDGTEIIRAPLPCLLTVVKEINEPRIPSLKGKLAAKKALITLWKSADLACDPAGLGLDGSPTKVVKIFSPPPRAGGEILKGEPEEAVRQLAEKLKDAVIAASA
ncbi:MAG: electron transfer flavoprotein subunit beta/FixA family protein [Kiritimatiellae bacterium]|nr:electron transfer flavoprotein subunit beta/FixA family protein [Kiritimatiellia bacterium]